MKSRLGLAWLCLVVALLLSACSRTLPVDGQFENGSVTFTGTATGYLDGSGTIALKASNGLTVTGNFVYVTNREGKGTFKASDGRSGSFTFVSSGDRGTGSGQLGDDKVTFTFGIK